MRQRQLLDGGAQALGVRRRALALEADEQARELLAAVARYEIARALRQPPERATISPGRCARRRSAVATRRRHSSPARWPNESL